MVLFVPVDKSSLSDPNLQCGSCRLWGSSSHWPKYTKNVHPQILNDNLRREWDSILWVFGVVTTEQINCPFVFSAWACFLQQDINYLQRSKKWGTHQPDTEIHIKPNNVYFPEEWWQVKNKIPFLHQMPCSPHLKNPFSLNTREPKPSHSLQ